MILSFINIRKVPREMLKTSGFALGFQHLPRDLANVNEWKIMFDPYIEMTHFSKQVLGNQLQLSVQTVYFVLTHISIASHFLGHRQTV